MRSNLFLIWDIGGLRSHLLLFFFGRKNMLKKKAVSPIYIYIYIHKYIYIYIYIYININVCTYIYLAWNAGHRCWSWMSPHTVCTGRWSRQTSSVGLLAVQSHRCFSETCQWPHECCYRLRAQVYPPQGLYLALTISRRRFAFCPTWCSPLRQSHY